MTDRLTQVATLTIDLETDGTDRCGTLTPRRRIQAEEL